jgi:hypothetical protein
MDVYVYYRVRSSHATELQAQAVVMQARLSEQYGIITALKRRPEEKNERHTWMEVYLAVPDGFDDALEQAVIQANLATLIDGERHIEHFLDLSACA